MATEERSSNPLSPDEAFSVLGDETRLDILRTLGEATEPLSFSALYEAADVADSGQFNYHLDKVVGHFVRKTDEGYVLRPPGRRVVEAVLSGAVTETPTLERTTIDQHCEYCGSPVEMQWRDGSVELYCTSCAGKFGRTRGGGPEGSASVDGYLGRLTLPPAGVRDRSPDEVARTAWTWTNLEVMAFASGICPRCSATVEYERSVCETHDASGGLCPECDRHNAVTVGVECTNCILKTGGAAVLALLSNTELLSFVTDHDYNPIAPEDIGPVNEAHQDYEEKVLSTDPFEARFTVSVNGDSLALTVDEDLEVVETARGTDSG